MKQILIFFVATLLISSCQTPPDNPPPPPGNEISQPQDYPVAQTALVIGNSEYQYQRLPNPINDANDMANSLKKLGFNVTLKMNLDRQGMDLAIKEFERRLSNTPEDDVGIFYFSGHGAQVNGENFLVPIDNDKIKSEADLRQYAVHATNISEMMKVANAGMNIITLDACRDNPYQGSEKTLTRGLARMPPVQRGSNVIAFATAPGATASDEGPDGKHGVYTYYLLEALEKSHSIRIDQVFSKVRDVVKDKTLQEPWLQMSLRQQCYFGGKCRRLQ
jgi:uncharacterized caspase-like protein